MYGKFKDNIGVAGLAKRRYLSCFNRVMKHISCVIDIKLWLKLRQLKKLKQH